MTGPCVRGDGDREEPGMAFEGWPAEALEFYEGLQADNSRTYWTRHKPVYDQQVLGPMADLVAELAPEFGDAKIFRPYRDVRFSKDKSLSPSVVTRTRAGAPPASMARSTAAGTFRSDASRRRISVTASGLPEAVRPAAR